MPEHDQLVELPVLFRSLVKKMTQDWNKRINESLTMSQSRMLYVLSVKGPMKAIEMAEMLSVTAGAITGMTDKLAEYGWVERERSDKDRRIVRLQLTEEGFKIVNSVQERERENVQAMFSKLTEEDIAHLRRIFIQLLEEDGQ